VARKQRALDDEEEDECNNNETLSSSINPSSWLPWLTSWLVMN
jgi:hypothetical protein